MNHTGTLRKRSCSNDNSKNSTDQKKTINLNCMKNLLFNYSFLFFSFSVKAQNYDFGKSIRRRVLKEKFHPTTHQLPAACFNIVPIKLSYEYYSINCY